MVTRFPDRPTSVRCCAARFAPAGRRLSRSGSHGSAVARAVVAAAVVPVVVVVPVVTAAVVVAAALVVVVLDRVVVVVVHGTVVGVGVIVAGVARSRAVD